MYSTNHTSCFLIFFFFSSRRRHTRCSRDWSSDVCSSDLISVTERLHEATALILLGSLVASGRITLRRIDGWRRIAALRRTLGAVHLRTFSCAPWRRERRGRGAPERRWSVP